jgi:TolA-binding protein
MLEIDAREQAEQQKKYESRLEELRDSVRKLSDDFQRLRSQAILKKGELRRRDRKE